MTQINVFLNESQTLYKTVVNPTSSDVKDIVSLVKEKATLMIEIVAANNRMFCLNSNNRWYIRYTGVTGQLFVNAVLMSLNERDESLIMFNWGGQRNTYSFKETVPCEIALIVITRFVEHGELVQMDSFDWHFIDELPLET
jgi:hypothetical protein